MANEDKKDFNAMMNDSKDMPKFQTITDEKSIEKYGGDRMYFAPPIDYDRVMRLVPSGKLLTVGKIREYFAKHSGADFTEPITAGIFVSIVAWASFQRKDDKTQPRQGGGRRFSMKRAVITGVGAVTPVGIGKEEVWKNYEP